MKHRARYPEYRTNGFDHDGCEFCGGSKVVTVLDHKLCESCWGMVGIVAEAMALDPDVLRMIQQSQGIAALPAGEEQ